MKMTPERFEFSPGFAFFCVDLGFVGGPRTFDLVRDSFWNSTQSLVEYIGSKSTIAFAHDVVASWFDK